jgi:hypothetical protein
VIVLKRFLWLMFALFYLINLSSCGLTKDNGTTTTKEQTDVPVITPLASKTPTKPKQLLFINRMQGWENVSADLIDYFFALADQQNWEYRSFQTIPGQADLEHASLIAIFGDGPDVIQLVESHPDTMFMLIAVSGVTPSKGLAIVGPDGIREDKLAFLSGIISALVTPEWRVGVLAIGDTGVGLAALESYLQGAIFFCGLCRPAYPPYHEYPTSVRVGDTSEESIQASLEQLKALSVSTTGFTHEFQTEVIDLAIGTFNSPHSLWIGPTAPTESYRSQWVVTVRPDPARVLSDIFERLIQGDEEIIVPMPIGLFEINDEVLTEGKLRYILNARDDLEVGVIDTGVDPQTGEPR